MSSTPPSTAEYLRFHALHQPRAVAVIERGREIDYATFHRDLGRFTRALRELGLPRGSAVAVAREGFYLHWLLLLACENLGWVTVSFLPREIPSLGRMLPHILLILSGRPPPQAPGFRWHGLTKEWVNGVFSSPDAGGQDPAGTSPLASGEAQRIRRSSGTTGSYKMMVTTRRIEEHRVEKNLQYMGFTPRSRFLVTTPFSVGSAYARATACLRLGATCIGGELDLARALVRYRPTHVWLFQFQMRGILGSVPDDFRETSDLTLMMGSAPVSPVLWRSLTERLTRRISYTYNSNEAGTIASVSQEGVCTVRPGVDLKVVDEKGRDVPAGQVGEIKVRAPAMIEGYLDDAELTAQKFRDGWFLTGDYGVMVAPGQFRLEGRADEMLNIGGRKYSSAALQARIESRVDVLDLGLTSVPAADGIEEMCVAVVLRDPAKLREIAEHIAKSLPKDLGTRHVKVVDAIPRTEETGKIRRAELKKLFQGK